jgi:hypothetical protein
MNPFDYISVVLAVVVGLALSHILIGMVQLLQRRGRVTFYWIHSTWIALTFVGIVFLWWSIWNFRNITSWNFFSFLLLLLQPVMLFLAAAFLVPREGQSDADMQTFYFSSRRGIFGSFAALLALIIAQNSIRNGSAWVPVNFYLLAAFVLIVAAAMTERRSFHAAVTAVFIIWMLAFITRFGLVLQFS